MNLGTILLVQHYAMCTKCIMHYAKMLIIETEPLVIVCHWHRISHSNAICKRKFTWRAADIHRDQQTRVVQQQGFPTRCRQLT